MATSRFGIHPAFQPRHTGDIPFRAGDDLDWDAGWDLYRWDGMTVERFEVNDHWDYVADASTFEEAAAVAERDFEENT